MMNKENELYNKLKEKISISNFDEEMQNKSYEINKIGVFFIKREILQAIATLVIIFVVSITVYAGVTGNLNFEELGLLKLSKSYDESTTEVNQSIENEYCKITLEKMAGDSAYLINEYMIEFKEKALDQVSKIASNNMYNLRIDGDLNINSKTVYNVKTFVDKIANNKYKYIEIVKVMDLKDEDLIIENNIDGIYLGEVFEERKIEINKTIKVDIKLKKTNIEKFEPIEQKIDENNKIIIENIANSKFESFIIIKQIKQDITWKEYNDNSLEYNSFLITDNKDNTLPYRVYLDDIYDRKIYVKKNENYIETDFDDYYDFKDNDIIKIEEKYTILLGLDENIKTLKITPTKTRIYNDRTDEEENAYNQAIWYDLLEGDKKYTQKSSLGGTLEINKIEVDANNVTFYYDKKGKIGDESLVLIRKNNGTMNYMGATETIEKNLSGEENKIIFSRENNEGWGCLRK